MDETSNDTSQAPKDERHKAWEEDGQPVEVGGLTLRTFSFRNFMRAAEELRLGVILCGEQEFEELPNTQVLNEVMIIAWMQSADPLEVRNAFKAGTEEVLEAVEIWQEGIEFTAANMRELMSEVLRVTFIAKKSWAQIVARDSAVKSDEDAPGNS